jgi:hypothetical protein
VNARHRSPTSAVLAALLAACAEAPDDVGPGQVEDPLCAGNVWYHDADHDGWGSETDRRTGCRAPDATWIRQAGDCDDRDPEVHPDGAERPNAADDDCDQVVDEGTARADDDGDGYCDDLVSCADPAILPGDCADDDPLRHPGAAERCDGEDGDCDGVLPADEADGDHDGAPSCADCDDADPDRHPGAPEACDGVDDDCDGAVDDRDADGDGFVGCPGVHGPLDVLLVVDGQRTAEGVRTRAVVELPALLGRVTATGRAWRVVALSGGGAELAEVDGADPDPAASLSAAILSTDEAVAPAPLDVAAGWVAAGGVRPGASLALWVVTNADDHGRLGLDEAADRLRHGGTPFAAAVVGAGWASCRVTDRRGEATPRLQAFAEAHGAAVSPCADGWAGALGGAVVPASAPTDCDDGDADVHPFAEEVCDGVDRDCDGSDDDDDDRDGVRVCAGDCDDHDARRFPGATEACDGVDGDCDGHLPEDESDRDLDGWRACAGDCDDVDPAVHPHALDPCGDGVDGDCRGGDARPGDDADGDGWPACAGDCDDGDATAFPGAPEHRFDGLDDDCDGLVDGEDDDQAEPVHLGSRLSRYALTSTSVLFRFCGTDWRSLAVTSTGVVLPGGAVWTSATPDEDELRDHAPVVTAGWAALDPTLWTSGRFLDGYGGGTGVWVVRSAGAVSVVFDHVPYADGDGFLTSVAHLEDGALGLTTLEARTDGSTVVGYACAAGGTWERVDTDGAPACLLPATRTAMTALLGDVDPAPPIVATETCPP